MFVFNVLIYHVSYIGVAVLTNIFEVVEEQDPDCEHEGGEDDEDHAQPAVHRTPHLIRLQKYESSKALIIHYYGLIS